MAFLNSDFYDCPDNISQMEFEWGANGEFMVDATVEWVCKGKDGIGSYEYHGSNDYDEGDNVWEISTVTFSLYDEDSNEVALSKEAHAEILEHIYHNAEPDFD